MTDYASFDYSVDTPPTAGVPLTDGGFSIVDGATTLSLDLTKGGLRYLVVDEGEGGQFAIGVLFDATFATFVADTLNGLE